MKFACDSCKKQFVYAAIKCVTADVENNVVGTEYRCCPFCGSFGFDEIMPEQAQESRTVKVAREATVEGVNERLAEGYVIVQEWAKETLLHLIEKPEVKGA